MGRQHAHREISKSDVWTAIDSTIWRTLTYSLPALNLTVQQCERIMRPILHYGLPALGICRNFPRKMVFAPHKYMGLGFKHLHTLQEIARLKDMINHTFQSSITGNLYRTSTELLLTELGVSENFSQVNYTLLHSLVTDSLVKSTWQFLYQHNIYLEHDIRFPHQRQGDTTLMQAFLDLQLTVEELQQLNECRLFL